MDVARLAAWAQERERKAVEIVRPAPTDYAEATLAAMGDATAFARLLVKPEIAFRVSVVLACARVIAEGLAQVPLGLFRKDGRQKVAATDHAAFDLVARQPNSWMTAFEWVETMTLHAVLVGAGYSYLNRVGGELRELIPLVPSRVTVGQDPDSLALTYYYGQDDGSTVPFPAEDIFCIRGPSWDGFNGLSLVRLAADAIGLAAHSEETQLRLHRNGTKPSGILTTDAKLDKDAVQHLRNSWQETFGGSGNAFKTVVLHNGMKWMPLSMSGVDAQHLETRKYQVEEICRFMRVFPQMVMSSGGHVVGSSTEQFFLAHITHCIAPWARRWEQAIDRDLLSADDRKAGLYPRFDLMELLRGDMAARAGFYSRGILDGWLTRNEARASEDKDPIDGLDLPLRPLNMGDGTKAPAPDAKPTTAGPGGSPGADQTLQPGDAPGGKKAEDHALAEG